MQKPDIENLDFSVLTNTESDFLKSTLQKKPFIWLLGMFLGITLLFAIIMALINGDNLSNYFYVSAGIKSLIFITLALWVRSWSLPAAILLLLWHLYSNMQLLLSKSSFSNLQYIAFSLLFLMGMFAVNKRRVLLKKVINTKPNPSLHTDG
jgi:hypothetical protein